MISGLSAHLNRHRRALMAAGLTLTVAEVAVAPGRPAITYAVVTVVGVAAAVTGGWLSWSAREDRTGVLLADARARTLATPRTGGELLFALAAAQALAFFAGLTATAALDGGLSRVGLLGSLLFAGMLAVTARSLPRGVGVTLRPDGIGADKVTGELFVPWEALAAAQPGPGDDPRELTLAYSRPGLVRASGIVPDPTVLEFEGVERAVLAEAIHHYAREPAARHAIGTAAEGARLGRGGYGLLPLPEPPALRATGMRALGGIVLFGGAVAVQAGLDPRHPSWSLFAVLPAWLGLRMIRRAWAGWRSLRDRRRPAL